MIYKLSPYFFIGILSVIIGYSFTLTFGSDYTFYFVTSDFLGDNRIIYNDFFTHKGPIYFIFLYLIKYIFGSSYLGYHIGFILTIFLFGIVFHSTVKIKSNKFLGLILSMSIFTSLFFFQSSNSSIQFFTLAFLLLFIFNLEKYVKDQKTFHLILSSIFLSISILTRVDSLVFLFIPFILFFKIEKQKKVLYSIIQVIIPVTIYYILKLILDFSTIDFYNHNLEFNYLYGKGDSSFLELTKRLVYREQTFILLCATGSILYIQKVFKFETSIKLLFLLLSFFLFVSTLSDKDYHILILLVPFFYFISQYIKTNDFRFIIISILCSFFVIISSFGRILKYQKLSNSLKDDSRLEILLDNDLNENSFIIGGQPYINFFIKNLKHQSTNNSWFYSNTPRFNKNKGVIRDHFKSLKDKNPFYLNKNLYDDYSQNEPIMEILENSVIVDEIGDFYKLKKVK